ncbi:MAG: hypothetical protein ABW136_02435 [Steroidobacteraceae bacterium]
MNARHLCHGLLLSTLGLASVVAATPPAEIGVAGTTAFPESLTSTPDGTVYIGGAGSRLIYRAKPGEATAQPWVLPGAEDAGTLGVFADAKARTLWSCGRPGGGAGQPTVPSTLRSFDLATGLPKARYPLPTAGGTCNDIAIGKDGAVYATDTSNMEVVRLARGAKALEVWAGDGAFGPKGGVLDGIAVLGNRVIVNTLATSKLFAIPVASRGAAGPVTEIKLDRPVDRPDGMRSHGNDSLLVAESGNGGRVSLVVISGDTGKRTVLKEGFPGGPVAVTAVGDTVYVLEGQLALLRDPKARPAPFKATAVPVGKR